MSTIFSTSQITLLDFTDLTFSATPGTIFVPASGNGTVSDIPDVTIALLLQDANGDEITSYSYKIKDTTIATTQSVNLKLNDLITTEDLQLDSGSITITAIYNDNEIDTIIYWVKDKTADISGSGSFITYPNNILKFITVVGNNYAYQYSPSVLNYEVDYENTNTCIVIVIIDNNDNTYYYVGPTNATEINVYLQNLFDATIQIDEIDSYLLQDTFSTDFPRNIKLSSTDATYSEAYIAATNAISKNIIYDTTVVNLVFGTSEAMAKFAINATNITGEISDTKMSFSQEGFELVNGTLSIYHDATRIFEVDNLGNAYLNGQIMANNGTIGGWDISEFGLSSDNMTTGLYAGDDLSFNDKIIRIWSGRTSVNDAVDYNFYVTDDGAIYANNAEIYGTIHARNGDITGQLLVGNSSNGVIIYGGDNSYISSAQYASGALGYGWRLEQDGTANFTNANISGVITSSVFEYNTTSAVSGNLYINATINSNYINKLSNQYNLFSINNNILLLDSSDYKSTSVSGDLDSFTLTKTLMVSSFSSSVVRTETACANLASSQKYPNNLKPGMTYSLSFNANCTFTNIGNTTYTAVTADDSYFCIYYTTNGTEYKKMSYLISLTDTNNIVFTIPETAVATYFTFDKDFSFTNSDTSQSRIGYVRYIYTIKNLILTPIFSSISYDQNYYSYEYFSLPTNTTNLVLSNGQLLTLSGKLNINNTIEDYSYSAIVKEINDSNILLKYKGICGCWIDNVIITENQSGLLLTASDPAGPFMDVYNKQLQEMPLVRLGNLDGITDANYFSQINGFGLYASNAYLRGQLMLPNAGITNQMDYSVETTENELSPVRIWAGNTMQDANFIVTQDGTMIAKQGIFNGRVEAINSTFSGVIRAAGIVIDNTTTTVSEATYDHFFVGYKDSPETNDDYVLNIDSTGLSIWQGGFKIYSDAATDTIYGYSVSTSPNPLPYIYIVDDYNNGLQSRLISYKQHCLQITGSGTNYTGNSIVFDNGIWFGRITGINAPSLVESQGFYNAIAKNNGIVYNGTDLSIISNQIKLKSNQNITMNNNLNIVGQLELTKGSNDNEIILGNCVIKQHYYQNTSIGFDLIVE